MQEFPILYKNILDKLNKDELAKIVDDYNNLAIVFNAEKLDIKKDKKKDILEKLYEIKETYFKYIIMLLDVEDYILLKKIVLKKIDEDILKENEKLINYLGSKYMVVIDNNIIIPSDLKDIFIKVLKDKEVRKYVNNNTKTYHMINGIVNAYGVLDIKSFTNMIDKIEKPNLIKIKMSYYYKKDYSLDKEIIINNKLTNKTKVDKYLNSKNYKELSNDDYLELGNYTYHKRIKNYKSFIKLLKRYYVFENKDVAFVDDKIIKPFVYDNLSTDALLTKHITSILEEYFEFNDDYLKEKIIMELTKIKDEMPTWKNRGYSKKEVNN